jgi:signal transduction histidine kinase
MPDDPRDGPLDGAFDEPTVDTHRRVSLRTRLTIAVGLVAACFLGAAAWLFGTRASDEVLNSAKDDQFVVAQLAQPAVAPGSGDAVLVYRDLQANDLIGPFYEIVGAPVPSPGQAVEVFDGTDTILVEGDPAAVGRIVLSAPLVVDAGTALLGGAEPSDIFITTLGATQLDQSVGAGGGRSASVPADSRVPTGGSVVAGTFVAAPGEPQCGGTDCPDGTGVISIAGDATTLRLDNVNASVQDLSRSLWVAAGVLTLLAIGATWLLAGRVLRPVGAITERVEAIGATGTGGRVPIPSTRDEIGHLARTMNGMLDRLDAAAGAQRRFVADASHELRSPLAVIRTETEVALAHPDATDWSAMGRSVLDETIRLEGLVTDLLTLARHDAHEPGSRAPGSHAPGATGEAGEARTVTDVEEVVMSEVSRSRRVPVDASRVLAGRAAAHPSEVARVIRHLVDNAARHADTQVAVEVTEVDGIVRVVVDDDGDGVPEADRARVFERFARLEDSRSRDDGGAGLGLAVVASITAERGGTAEVGESPLGGARFTVTFPSAAVDEPVDPIEAVVPADDDGG